MEKVSAVGSWTYVLEASIERLKLLPGELSLSLQLVQALRLVTHRRQLQITVAAVCGGKRQTERERDGQTDRKREKKERERSDVERGGKMKRKRGRMGQTLSVCGCRSGRGGITLSTGRHLLQSRWGKTCKFKRDIQQKTGEAGERGIKQEKEVLSLRGKYHQTSVVLICF